MRSPAVPTFRALGGQPWWVRIGLVATVVASGLVSSWNIGYAGYTAFYSAAARSMSLSWRAFAFGAFDPSAHITLDKLSGFLVPQALSARVFGFHPWSIALPQVIEGLITVLVTYVVGTRWKGPKAGLLAAAFTATTPLLASMFGHVMEDGLLTMSLAIAFACMQSAMLSGRLAPLLFAALWVAIGFQAKMMQAWIIVPALGVGLLLGGRQPIARRALRTALASGVIVVLSLTWMTAIQLVPSKDRPYIDGSTNNNVYSMVFGYNGFNRIVPNTIPGALGDEPRSPARPKATAANAAQKRKKVRKVVPATPGGRNTKLFLPFYATQVGWLYPLALGGIVLGLWPLRRNLRRRAPPASTPTALPIAAKLAARTAADPTAADAVLFVDTSSLADTGWVGGDAATTAALAVWLLLAGLFLTVADVPHTAYFAAISVQIALLAAAGVTEAIRLFRSNDQRVRTVLPVLFIAEVAWTTTVAATSNVAPSFVAPVVAILGVAMFVVLVVVAGRLTDQANAVIASALAVMVFAPLVWTGSVLSRSDEGSAGEAYAGPKPHVAAAVPLTAETSASPEASASPGTSVAPEATAPPAPNDPFRISRPFIIPPDPHLDEAQTSLAHYIARHTAKDRPTMATDLWVTASPYIIDQRMEVLPMGGFSGRVATPTLDEMKALVSAGRIRFVLLNDVPVSPTPAQQSLAKARGGGVVFDSGGTGDFEGTPVLALRAWVAADCALVPAPVYERDGRTLRNQTLFACSQSSPTALTSQALQTHHREHVSVQMFHDALTGSS